MVASSVFIAARLYWRRMGLMVLANLLWLALSLLIVTWPAATAGLFTLVRRVVEEEVENAPHEASLRDFWDGFRRHGLRSTLVTALELVGIVVLVVALLFYGRSEVEPFRWLVGPLGLIGLLWIASSLYVYPLLVLRAQLRPWEIIRAAGLIALGYPLSTLSLLLTSLVLLVAAVALAGPVLLVFFSAMALLQTVALRQVLLHHDERHEVTP
jgi:uncharacterized membrane protein YesL